MDQEIRNKLRNVVTQCRRLLEEAISQELEGKFGIFAKKDQVIADPNAEMSHLSDEDRSARRDILDHYAHIKARGFNAKDALDQLVREVAFTHLNRLCAYKMMEAHEVYVGGQKFREAVSRGVNSTGVKFYLAEHEEDERLFNTGKQDIAYRHYLDWLGAQLSQEIGVLFSPNDPANRLYPRQKTLDEVLDLLNGGGIKAEETELRDQWPQIWSQDETIGWVYQYFTPKELRDQARKESQAPRNSYELAFRNQFFTPRYVVEFLTDNTLGRIWYEMRKGDSKLKDQCRYMVRRPTEIFLQDGENPPKGIEEGKDDLSQEELLKLPVHIPHRPKKDPRELKILDPACGSGHFLLYCFDLLLTIYEEAYSDPDLGPALMKDYPTLVALKRNVPRLILAHNLHGIDIDLRASQIAALALWLRCQRAYQEMGLKKDRPQITRSNFVCAEPMPGEERMLQDFVHQLEPRALGQIVEVVFDKMKLAGEAGSLLKIEEEIRDAIHEAKSQYEIGGLPIQRSLFDTPTTPVAKVFSVKDITDEDFFEQAESRVIEALRTYAEKAQDGQRLQRRLFSEDAVRGFAFVDLCQKRYDVILMNPPFGLGLKRHFSWLKSSYHDAYVDLCASFLFRAAEFSTSVIGAITSRSILVIKKLANLRKRSFVPNLSVLLDLGHPVMDGATVQSCAYVLDIRRKPTPDFVTALDRTSITEKSAQIVAPLQYGRDVYSASPDGMCQLPQSRVLYSLPQRMISMMRSSDRLGPEVAIVRKGMTTFNDFRFLRLRHEVNPNTIGRGREWQPVTKGGGFSMFYSDVPVLVRWGKCGEEVAQENIRANGQTAQARQASGHYYRSGGIYTRRCRDFGVRLLPAGCILGDKGPAVLPEADYSAPFIVGFLNSRFVNRIVHIQANAKQFDPGIVEAIPWKSFKADAVAAIEEACLSCFLAGQSIASTDETTSVFTAPPLSGTIEDIARILAYDCESFTVRLQSALKVINRHVEECFGVSEEDIASLERFSELEVEGEGESYEVGVSDEDEETDKLTEPYGVHAACNMVLSYCFGVMVGRWDLRKALSGVRALPEWSTPLPPCSPGTLVGDNNLPAERVPDHYLIRVCEDGIIPDDPKHAGHLMQRLREVFQVIWKERADTIEEEVCGILGVKALSDHFRKPGKGGFWDDHITRYTKSRRKAPIYWLLQSSKNNYAIWLYYHRLDKDLLFKALVNYVEPKIRLEIINLESLRARKSGAGESGKEVKRLAKEVEKQEDFLSELRDFEDKLRRAANLHLEPDLNDGVVLNIALLHELVPWKEAKKYWDELMEGKYEWSSIGKQLREKGLVKS